MPPRPYVDFSYVPEHQAAIHERLVNWARWFADRGSRFQSPMFRMHRSTEIWRDEREIGQAVDGADATKLQVAVVALPTPHRLAVSWAYIKRDNPRKAAQQMGLSLEGLALMVKDARTMLINRGA